MIMSNSMSNKEFIEMMISTAKDMNVDLSEHTVSKFIDIFSETMKRSLCKYPNISIDKLGYFSISRLSNRKRVLRNKEYWTKTFYKVRYYVTQEIQEALFKTYEGDLDPEDLE